MKENSNKRIDCVGDISPDKPHIWSKVYRGGVTRQSWHGGLRCLEWL